MNIAAYQAPLDPSRSFSDVVGLIQDQVEICERAGIEFLCCPEGLFGGLADYAPDPASIAVHVENGELAALLAPLASTAVTTIVGFTERGGDGHLYNAAAVYSHGRIVGSYRKLHPAVNRSLYRPGKELPVFTVRGLTFGILICLDSNDAELYRRLVAQGAVVVFIPTNNGLPSSRFGPEVVAEARRVDLEYATRHRRWIVRADVVGEASGLHGYGATGIVSPDGAVFAVAAPGQHSASGFVVFGRTPAYNQAVLSVVGSSPRLLR